MNLCPKCSGANLRDGKLTDDLTTGMLFQPNRVKLFTGWLRGTRCDEQVTACLDRGLVWTHTPAAELREFVQKYGKS